MLEALVAAWILELDVEAGVKARPFRCQNVENSNWQPSSCSYFRLSSKSKFPIKMRRILT